MEGLRCQLPVPRPEQEGAEKHVVWPIFVSARLSVPTPGYRETSIVTFENLFSYSLYFSTAFLKKVNVHIYAPLEVLELSVFI